MGERCMTGLMVELLRHSKHILCALALVSFLTACSGGGAAGLNPFQSPDGRYGFLYPTGWTQVAVNEGPQVVFHDLINSDETLSLVVSEVGQDVDLESLGSPEAVGEKLITGVVPAEGSNREVQLLEANERAVSGHIFYDLEYLVHLPDQERHELATVVVDRGFLYTLATSTNESRWPRVKDLFSRVIISFTFLI